MANRTLSAEETIEAVLGDHPDFELVEERIDQQHRKLLLKSAVLRERVEPYGLFIIEYEEPSDFEQLGLVDTITDDEYELFPAKEVEITTKEYVKC